MARFSRILDLPTELRYNIYQQAVLLPETLHVSLTGSKSRNLAESFDLMTGEITKSSVWEIGRSGTFDPSDSRKISFEHIVESQDRLVIEPFSVSRFRVNRQIYAELQHLFYSKTTWYFNSLDSLIRGLMFLPGHVRMKIRHLAFTMMAVGLESYDFPQVKCGKRAQSWCLPLVSSLLQSSTRLQRLSIRYSKTGLLLQGVVKGDGRDLTEGHKAACAVAAFVWPGVVTIFLYSNDEMTAHLVRSGTFFPHSACQFGSLAGSSFVVVSTKHRICLIPGYLN
jgi:hypothetical protein